MGSNGEELSIEMCHSCMPKAFSFDHLMLSETVWKQKKEEDKLF